MTDPFLWTGTVSLADGTNFDIHPVNEPTATITVNRTSALGALDAAATAGAFSYTITNTSWGPFIDSIGGVAYNATSWDSWLYQVNGVTADVGASDFALKNGDVVTYWYGAWGSDPATAPNRVEITVEIPSEPGPVRWNGTVSLTDGETFDVPALNDPTVFTINRTSALGALDKAATAGGFDYTVNNSTWGPFLNSIGGVAYNPTNYDSWLYQVNGVEAPVGLAAYELADGDVVTLWYGAWGSDPATAPNLVEITVEIPSEPTPTPTVTSPPVGGDTGYFLVSTVPAGAQIFLRDIGGTLYPAGNTTAGPLNVTVYLTGTPMKAIVANLSGYPEIVWNITQYPAKGQTVPVDLVFENGEVTPTVTVTATPTVTAAPGPEGPFNGPHVPSVKIEAEDFDSGGEGAAYHDTTPTNEGGAYRPSESVDIEVGGSNFNVGWVRDGEWLTYTIDSTATGDFNLVLRASNPDTTAKTVRVLLDGVYVTDVVVDGTGNWFTFEDFVSTSTIPLPIGRSVITLSFDGINRINLDWLNLVAGEPTPTNPGTTPYGPDNNIPGRVEAENFDVSGTGDANAAYSDTTPANEGGLYRTTEPVDIEYWSSEASHTVGWIRSGEWLVYTVDVTKTGTYTATFRAANPDSASKPIDVFVDGAKVGTINIGSTGSFATFKNFAMDMNLQTGTHQIRLSFPMQRLNLNYIEFSTDGSSGGQPPASGEASFTATPTTAKAGSEFRFAVTAAPGKTIKSVWWSFDAPKHLNTWNSRIRNPAFFYPNPGTYSPLVRITYTDGTTEEVQRVNYIRAT